MTLSTVRFDIDIVAKSSIVHGQGRSSGRADTVSVFRREKIITPDGDMIRVPVVSGNSFRGVLRRIGEGLTADVLRYEQSLPIPAAHLLTNGGRLGKTDKPMTDDRERTLKELIPQIAIFGGDASGRVMSGLLTVSKVLPEVAELAHILPRPPSGPLPSAIRGMTAESYTHLADHRPSTSEPPVMNTEAKEDSPLGIFGFEALSAGTRMQSWVQISHATDYQLAFFNSVLAAFAERGHLGGRSAAGHGAIKATVHATALRGELPNPDLDWAAQLRRKRRAAIKALTDLT